VKLTRRQLAALIPALAAAQTTPAPAPQVLGSNFYPFDSLTLKGKSRSILNGLTHENFPIEAHVTDLQPGEMPHPAHHHAHEELILFMQGQVDVTIAGKTATLGPGSSCLFGSGDEHGMKNNGTVMARYFVVAFGKG